MNEMRRVVPATAKLFWTGRSQAVRLPKEFRFEGKEVRISREEGRVVLEPVSERLDDKAWIHNLRGFDADFIAAALDRPGPDHPDNTLDDDPSFD